MRIQAKPTAQPTRPMFDDFRPDGTRYELDTKLIFNGLDAMYWQAKSRVYQAFKARGIADGRPSSFIVHPPIQLQELYETITGIVNANDPRSVIVSGASAEDLALSLFSAFLVRVVFGGSWVETFDEFQAKPSDGTVLKKYCVYRHPNKQAIRSFTDHPAGTDRDTVLRKAYFLHHCDKEWTQRTFGAIADQLSNDFAVRLEKHLGVHHGVDGQSYGPSMYDLAKHFTLIISQALISSARSPRLAR